MEPVSLWAAVEFTACNGSTEALLTAAARAGLHPYGVTALPGGFGGRCAAWQYPRLAALAASTGCGCASAGSWGCISVCAPCCAGPGFGGAGGVCAAAALCTAIRLVCGHLFPHHRTGCAGLRRPAGSGPAARCGCDRGKAHRRGVRPFAQRRVLLGQPEFCQRAAGGGSRRGQAQTGHCRRNAARHPGKMQRHCSRTNLTSGTMLVQPGQQVEAGQGLIGTAAPSGTAP